MPSPNMPAPETDWFIRARFSGKEPMSLKEEDCRPFESFGAPFLDPGNPEQASNEDTEGCCLQDIFFRPTFNKWQGELCRASSSMSRILPPSGPIGFPSLSYLQSSLRMARIFKMERAPTNMSTVDCRLI